MTAGGEVHVLTHSRDRPLQPARTVPLPGGGGLGCVGARLLQVAWVSQRTRTLLFLVAPAESPEGEAVRPGLAMSTWLLPERAGPSGPEVKMEVGLPAAAVAAAAAVHDPDLCAVACEVGCPRSAEARPVRPPTPHPPQIP